MADGVVGSRQRTLKERVQTGLFGGRGGNDADTEHLLDPLHVDLVPLCLRLVVDVEGHDHRDAQLQELHRQVEVPLQVGGVHHVDDQVGALVAPGSPGR